MTQVVHSCFLGIARGAMFWCHWTLLVPRVVVCVPQPILLARGPSPSTSPRLRPGLVRAAVPFHWSPWMWIRPRAPRPRAASAAAGSSPSTAPGAGTGVALARIRPLPGLGSREGGFRVRPSGRPSVFLGCRLRGHQLPLGPDVPGVRQGATRPRPWLLAVATLLLPLARKGAGGPALGAGPPPPLRPGPPRRRRLAPLARCWEAPPLERGLLRRSPRGSGNSVLSLPPCARRASTPLRCNVTWIGCSPCVTATTPW